MPITKDGFYKSISKNTSIGDNSYVLLAGGGHRKTGNNGPSSDGDNYYSYSYIPLSNSVLNKYLNADMVDGLHVHLGTNNEANKIVRTNSNGIIYSGTIDTISNQTVAINNGTNILKRIYVSNIYNQQYISYIYPEDFYSNFENSGNNVSLTIGGYNRTLEISYAATSYIADNAKQSFRLKGDSTYTAWGQNYWTNGIPNSISGDMTSVGNITPISDKTKSSGSSSNEWLNVYTYNLISNSTLYINSSNTASIVFKKGNTELGRFYYNNGYLGLNVQTPSQRLHVNGNAFITGSFYLVGPKNRVYSDGDGTNIAFEINSKVMGVFNASENTFRRGQSYPNITLGTNTYPWYATYSSGFYHTGLTSSVLGSGETRDDYVILGGGGYMKLSDLSMSHEHPYLPLAGGTMTGTIYRNYTAASNEPMLSLASNNQDIWLWRIKDYGTGSATATSGVYGFGLKYIGTGVGVDNRLKLIADNQTSTAVTAIDINQSGQIGIGTDPNTNYRVNVNGHGYFSGDLVIDKGSSIGALGTGALTNGITVKTNNHGISLGIGTGGINRGIYDQTKNKWLIYTDNTNIISNLGALVPGVTNSQDLGSTSYRWNILYANKIRTANYEISEAANNRLAIGNYNQMNAKGLNAGDLLISNLWSDYTLVPTNGIYSKGQIKSGVADGTPPFDVSSKTQVQNLYAEYSQKIKPLYEKEFDYTSASNTTNNNYIYFGNITPISDNYTRPWIIRYKLYVWLNSSDQSANSVCQGYYDCTIYGSGTTITYKNFNTFYSGSYRPIYYHTVMYYYTTGSGANQITWQTKYANRQTHPIKVGCSVSYAYSITSSRHYRVEVYDLVNCEFSFPENIETLGSVYTANDYGNYISLDAYSQGLRETSDDNDTTTLNLYYTRITAGLNGIKQYSLIMQDISGTWQSFTLDGGIEITKQKNPIGFRLGSRVYYVSDSGNRAAGYVLGNSTIRAYISLVDLRYSLNINTTLNGTVNNLVPYKPVYIVGTIGNDGLFYLDDLWWTQDEPTTEDGKVYIRITESVYPDYGDKRCYRGDLISDGYAFWFKDGQFRRYNTFASSSFDDRYVKKIGDEMSGQLHINYDDNVVSNNSETGSLVIGDKTSDNIGIDGNEIMARTGDAVGSLYLQKDGGNIHVGSTIHRTISTAAQNTPMISLHSMNLDTWIWRVRSADALTQDATSGVYGFGLKYIGSGTGINNRLKLIADNQTSTAVTAIDINQHGKVSIGGNLPDSTSYMLTVNGAMSTGLITTSGAAITAFDKVYAANGNSEVHPITKANFLNGLLGLTSTAVGSLSVPIYWTGSTFERVQATFGSQGQGEHNANNIKSNGLWYYSSNGPTTNHGASTADGALYSQAYSTLWTGQIAQDYRNGNLFVRGLNNGTWQPWKAIATADYEYVIDPVANVVYNPKGKKITVVGGTDNSWDTEVYSYSGYNECTLTYKVGQNDKNIIVGLTLNHSMDPDDIFGWYMKSNGNLSVIENGFETNIGNYLSNKEFTIKYSDGIIKYFYNGKLRKTLDISEYNLNPDNIKFYMDALFYNYNSSSPISIYDVNFRPAYDDDNIEIIDLRYYG